MRPRSVLLTIAGLSLGAVGLALVTQHFFDYQPCPWCVLQRLEFVAIAAIALLGVAWRTSTGVLVSALAIVALSAAGVATALWQHFVAAVSASCNQTLADRIVSGLGLDGALPEIFQPRANCADAAVKLLGISYEFYSLALFVLIGAMALRLLTRLRVAR